MLEIIKITAKRILIILACMFVFLLLAFIFDGGGKTYRDGVKSGLYRNIKWGSSGYDVVGDLGLSHEKKHIKNHRLLNQIDDYEDMWGVNADEIYKFKTFSGLNDIEIRVRVIIGDYTIDEVFQTLIDDYEGIYGDPHETDQRHSFWITEESEILISKSKDEVYIHYYPAS